jgi:hypothetical protein
MSSESTPRRPSWTVLPVLARSCVWRVRAAEGSASEWVYPGPDGKLTYKKIPAGDSIMDFSCAGYMGGGVNCRALDGEIDSHTRPSTGSGHGSSTGWAVARNCEAKDYVIQNPPGAANWMIGCVGASTLKPSKTSGIGAVSGN